MCGFCGIASDDRSSDTLERTVRSMVRTLAHRGPDAEGVHVERGLALAHRRLSIIDLSANGAQPMTLGATTVAYNGEIYNFQELRSSLQSEGCQFRGRSDTEVLLHAYDKWGLAGLSRLEGMFAFALWDFSCRRLILMRDRLGIKPLFYSFRDGALLFGSEIKAVRAAGSVRSELDRQALSEYLWFGNAYEDRTIYQDVRSLSPGHRLIFADGRCRIESWWRIEEWSQRTVVPADAADAAVQTRDTIQSAVARQLVSDVPVGIFLSGGIDSSTIATCAAAVSDRPLKSFSVGFDHERNADELPKARRVAQSLGLDHHEFRISGLSAQDAIGDLVRAHDEPFADAANIPLYMLAQQLGGSVKVVLQGDGGDEMFAGYRRYSILRNAQAWRFWPNVLSRFLQSIGSPQAARLARLGAAAGVSDPALRMSLLLTVETLADPPTSLLSDDVKTDLARTTDPFLAYRRCADRFAVRDPVQQMLLTDLTLQLPSQFLTKVDRATMAHGIEVRVPLLDERVAEMAVGMPAEYKVRGAQKKIVLRDAMRGRVADEILDGPKTGFGVPFEYWMREALHDSARAVILDGKFIDRFGFDRERLTTALDQHRAGVRNRGFMMWKLYQLGLWSREYLQ